MKIEIPKPRADIESQAIALTELFFRIVQTAVNGGYTDGAICTALVRNTANLIDQLEPPTKAEALALMDEALGMIREGKAPWTH